MLKELKNTVVHCKTPEENSRFLDLCHENGWKKKDYWGTYKGETCYHANGSPNFCDRGYYIQEKYIVLSLSDFLKQQGLPDKTEARSIIHTFTVYEHDNCPVKLWCRGQEVQVEKGAKGKPKTYTVTGDLDQWASAFFDGYLAAQ